jgi:hypothetical protein
MAAVEVVERLVILALAALVARGVSVLAGTGHLGLAAEVVVAEPLITSSAGLPLVEEGAGLDCLGQALLGLVDWEQRRREQAPMAEVVALAAMLGLLLCPRQEISTILSALTFAAEEEEERLSMHHLMA